MKATKITVKHEGTKVTIDVRGTLVGDRMLQVKHKEELKDKEWSAKGLDRQAWLNRQRTVSYGGIYGNK